MKKIANAVSRACYDRGLGLLVIRVAVGLIFLTHGWDKMHNIEGVVRMMGLFGFPAWSAYFITGLEVIGGAALILGVATRLFGFLFGVEMAVATILVGTGMSDRGFHGYEFEMLLSAVSFGVALMGSGKFSLFRMECGNCGGMFCRGGRGGACSN